MKTCSGAPERYSVNSWSRYDSVPPAMPTFMTLSLNSATSGQPSRTATQQPRMSASREDRIGIVVDHDAVFAPEQDDRYRRMEQYADGGFQARRPGFHRAKRFRPVMAGYQLCRAAAACQERRIVASPNHVEVYLATCSMTFQLNELKLREDAEVPHAVEIEEGDALDGPDRSEGQMRNALRG